MSSIVKFVGIRDQYFTQTNLRCEVLINVHDSFKDYDSFGNRIELCKVGWGYYYSTLFAWLDKYKCIASKGYFDFNRSSSKDNNHLLSVYFLASEVPKAGKDYYQFCYFTKDNQLLGVSKHFQFIAPKNPLEPSVEERIKVADNKLDKMSNDFSELKTTVGKLTDRLSAKRIEDISALKARRVESEAQIECIKALNKNIEEQSIMIKEQQSKQREDLKAGEELFAIQINELRQQLTTTSVENTRLKKSIEDNESSVNVLKSQLMACRVESEAKSERINALALSLEEMKKLKNDYKSRVESLERDVKALRDENKSLKSREYKGLDSSQSRVQEVIVHNRETAIQAIDELYKTLSETTHKTMAEERKAREEVFMKNIKEIKDQLTITSEEYQLICNQNNTLENRIKEMKNKLKNYFESKDLFVREETEVKSLIDSELGVEVLDSESVASDDTSIATVSEELEVDETVIDGKVVYTFPPNV